MNLDASKAQAIYTAYKRKTGSIDDIASVFVNAYGSIIVIYNEYNFKQIGRVINDTRFEIGGVSFLFPETISIPA